MEARRHPTELAKRLLPNLAFGSFDKVFYELSGPKREAFLMYLWREAGQGLAEQVPPVSVGRVPGQGTSGVVKLEVVGALRRGPVEIVVVSMPPAIAPNEAVFVALVRAQGRVTVYFSERCLDASGALSPTDVALAAVTPEGRSNLGFASGDGLASFRDRLASVLGVSLEGLETSLPPITMEAFMAAPQGGVGVPPFVAQGSVDPSRPSTPEWHGARQVAAILMPATAVRAAISLVLRFVPIHVPGMQWIMMLYSLVLSVLLIVWLYRVLAAYRGQAKYTPGWAVGAWFVPFANFLLPALVVRDAYKTVTRTDGTPLVLGWWFAWVATSLLSASAPILLNALVTGSRESMALTITAFSWGTSLAALLNYGLLWLIVKRVDG